MKAERNVQKMSKLVLPVFAKVNYEEVSSYHSVSYSCSLIANVMKVHIQNIMPRRQTAKSHKIKLAIENKIDQGTVQL